MTGPHPPLSDFDPRRGPRMWCWNDGRIRPLYADTTKGLNLTQERPRVFCRHCDTWVFVLIEINVESVWDAVLTSENLRTGRPFLAGWEGK